jgi:phospholipase A1
VRAAIDRQPAFGIYKDNNFAIGTTIGSAPTRENSDVKFQISIRQRLTRQELPFHSYLYLFYTQKTLWNVFQESLPMHDMNFNPGIGWSKLLIKDGQVSGNIILLLEHESNGKDGDDSRSWNKIGLSLSHYISPTLMIHGKGFIPIIDGKQNKDILDYTGFVQCSIQKVAQDRRWVFNLTLDKRKGWNLNFNTTVQFGLRLKHEANQYFFLQYYNGYGECLLDYNRFTSALRIGLLIRPSFFSEF